MAIPAGCVTGDARPRRRPRQNHRRVRQYHCDNLKYHQYLHNMDITAALERYSVDGLQAAYQQRLRDSVRETFSDEFVVDFYRYLGHPGQEFVVTIGDIWRTLGCTEEYAIRGVMRDLVEGVDYQRLPTAELALSVESFKVFCLLVGTEEGARLRTQYVRMEGILRGVEQEQAKDLERRLAGVSAERVSLQQRIDRERRRYVAGVVGEVVYIFGDEDEGTMYHKIGCTADLKLRGKNAGTFNRTGTMLHSVPCINAKVVEAAVLHILDKRRQHKKQEWFEISFEQALATVEAAQLMLDAFVEQPEQVIAFLPALKQAVETTSQPAAPQPTSSGAVTTATTTSEPTVQATSQQPCPASAPTQLQLQLKLQPGPPPPPTQSKGVKRKGQPEPATQQTVSFTIPDRKTKRLVQYELDGSFVDNWPTAANVQKSGIFGRDISVYTNVWRAAAAVDTGRKATAFGYIWRNLPGEIEKEVEYREDARFKQLRPDGSLVTSYTQLAIAAAAAGIQYSNIRSVFNSGDLEAGKGYYWVTDNPIEPLRPQKRAKQLEQGVGEME